MAPWLSALLCLGSVAELYLAQEIQAQTETLPRPQLILENGAVVRLGSPMAVRCRGPASAHTFYLQKEQEEDFVASQPAVWNEARFSFPRMEDSMTGVYSCVYQTRTSLSPPSETVNLAVSGVLPRPFLSATPGNKVAPGEALSFKCWTDQKYDRLIVYQDRGFIPPMFRLAPDRDIELKFPRVSAKHGGIYSCMGFVGKEPLKWSMPSDPVVLTGSASYTCCFSELPSYHPKGHCHSWFFLPQPGQDPSTAYPLLFSLS